MDDIITVMNRSRVSRPHPVVIATKLMRPNTAAVETEVKVDVKKEAHGDKKGDTIRSLAPFVDLTGSSPRSETLKEEEASLDLKKDPDQDSSPSEPSTEALGESTMQLRSSSTYKVPESPQELSDLISSCESEDELSRNSATMDEGERTVFERPMMRAHPLSTLRRDLSLSSNVKILGKRRAVDLGRSENIKNSNLGQRERPSPKESEPSKEAQLTERLKGLEAKHQKIRKLRTSERKRITTLKEDVKISSTEIIKLKQDVKNANEALASQVIEHSTKEKALKKELQEQNNQLSRALEAQRASNAKSLDEIVRNQLRAGEIKALEQSHEFTLSSLKKECMIGLGSLKAQLTTESTKSAKAEQEILKLRADLQEAQEKLACSEMRAIRSLLAEKKKDVANLEEMLNNKIQEKKANVIMGNGR